MRSCSTCGQPFEPGDRTCSGCGRSRTTSRTLAGDARSPVDDGRWRPPGVGSAPTPNAPPDRSPGSPAPVTFGPPAGAPRRLVDRVPASPPVFPPAGIAPTGLTVDAFPAGASSVVLPPPWERDLDTEPAWEELVGPDGELGHDAGADGDVAVGRGGLPWRWLLAGIVLVALIAAGFAVAGRTSGTSALLGDVGIERRLPTAITRTPTLRWRAAGVGSSADEAANGGGGGLVTADEDHVYAVPGDGHNVLTALDIVTGETSWTVPLDDVTTQLYVVDGLVVAATNGRVIAYDAASGLRRWSSLGQFVYQPWSGGPILAGRFGDAPTLAVLDPVTGADRWVTTTGATGNWWSDRSGLFWPTCSGVQRLDWLDGRVRWTYPTGADLCAAGSTEAIVTEAIVVAGSTAVVQVRDSWVGLDVATGAKRWTSPRAEPGSAAMVVLDGGHLAITEHRQSDADRIRVLDVGSGAFTAAEIDGHFEVLHLRQGDDDRLYAFNGSSLRVLDRTSYAVTGPSVPMEGFFPSPLGDRALATDTTYAMGSEGGGTQLAGYALSNGAARWRIEVGVGSRLVVVGKVLVLLDAGDLVAYG